VSHPIGALTDLREDPRSWPAKCSKHNPAETFFANFTDIQKQYDTHETHFLILCSSGAGFASPLDASACGR
jgi:hypothetical protein